MSPRSLPILNALGGLVLTGIVVAQWLRERDQNGELLATRDQLAAATQLAHSEADRRKTLEKDLAVLKEAIAATQQSAETTTRELGEQATLNQSLKTELETARTQVTAWETALKERDKRISDLTTDLSATRQRLTQAVEKLKQAGGR